MTSLTTLFECDGTTLGALTVAKASNQEYRTVLQSGPGEVLHDTFTFWKQLRRPDLLEAMSFELGWLEALAEDASKCTRQGIPLQGAWSRGRGGIHVSYSPEAHAWAAECHETVKDACKALGISLRGLDR